MNNSIYICYFIPFSLLLIVASPSAIREREPECIRKLAQIPRTISVKFISALINPLSFEKYIFDYFEKQPIVLRRRKASFYGGLFSIDDIDKVLLEGRYEENSSLRLINSYGRDWKLIRRVKKNGKWWTGVFPEPENEFKLEEVHSAFNQGFSLLINEVQRFHAAVHQAVGLLEEALGYRVNANLYLTPASAQGFEAHFDWMDGFIMHLAGSKHWVVYSPPSAPLPRPDLVFRPDALVEQAKASGIHAEGSPGVEESSDNTSAAASEVGEAQHFDLQAGDFLYLPRGITHEANTRTRDKDKDKDKDKDVGTSAAGQQQDNSGGVSLHLTLGVEVATHYSVETLLHHHLLQSRGVVQQYDQETSLCSDSAKMCLSRPMVTPNRQSSPSLVHTLLHTLVSLAGAQTDSLDSLVLRRAVGVTVLSVEVLDLSPLRCLRSASKFVLNYTDGLFNSSQLVLRTISYLSSRQLLRLRTRTRTGTGTGTAGEARPMLSSRTEREGPSLSADYQLTYLRRFLGDVGARDSGGEVSGGSAGQRNGDWWMELTVSEETFDRLHLRESPSLVDADTDVNTGAKSSSSVDRSDHYSTEELLSALSGEQWLGADRWLRAALQDTLGLILSETYSGAGATSTSSSNSGSDSDSSGNNNSNSSSSSSSGDGHFCRAWGAFMEDIGVHRRDRQRAQLESLRASGQKPIYDLVDAEGGAREGRAAKATAKKTKLDKASRADSRDAEL